MDIKNIIEDNGVYFYRAKNFATIEIRYLFKAPSDKFEVAKLRILNRYLYRTNKKYPTSNEIRKKVNEFYNISFDIYVTNIGSKNFMAVNIILLNPKMIDENYLEDALEFMHDILFNPNFTDNKLDKKILNQIKEDMINNEKANLASPSVKSDRILFSKAFSPSTINDDIYLNIEDFKEHINKVSDEDIINTYNNLYNNFYKGFIFGDLTKKDYKTIKKYLPFKSNNKHLDYTDFVKVKKGKETIEDNTLNDSTLTIVYQINNYSLDKWYIYRIISVMFNSSCGLCHEILRKKYGLTYTSSAAINSFSYWGVMTIDAKIDSKNKNLCIKAIREMFMNLKNKDVVTNLLNFAKEYFNELDFISDETVGNIISDLKSYAFKTSPTRDTLHELTNNTTVEDIIKEIDNIEEKYIHFYKGVKNEN